MTISHFGNTEPLRLVDICTFDLIAEIVSSFSTAEVYSILNALANAGKYDAVVWAMYNWVRNDPDSRMLIPQADDPHPTLTAECPSEDFSFSIAAPYAELEILSGFHEIVGEERTFMRLGEVVGSGYPRDRAPKLI